MRASENAHKDKIHTANKLTVLWRCLDDNLQKLKITGVAGFALVNTFILRIEMICTISTMQVSRAVLSERSEISFLKLASQSASLVFVFKNLSQRSTFGSGVMSKSGFKSASGFQKKIKKINKLVYFVAGQPDV